MGDCKRMSVYALGIDKEGIFKMGKNYNKTECTGEIGNCGCVHAEINLLEEMKNPQIVVLTHSPCLDCAKKLVEAGVQSVYFFKPYRIYDGIEYLMDNGVWIEQIVLKDLEV